MPLLYGNNFHLGSNRRKDGVETCHTMRGKLYSALDGVQYPTQNDFLRIPSPISLQQFLEIVSSNKFLEPGGLESSRLELS